MAPGRVRAGDRFDCVTTTAKSLPPRISSESRRRRFPSAFADGLTRASSCEGGCSLCIGFESDNRPLCNPVSHMYASALGASFRATTTPSVTRDSPD